MYDTHRMSDINRTWVLHDKMIFANVKTFFFVLLVYVAKYFEKSAPSKMLTDIRNFTKRFEFETRDDDYNTI